MCVFIQKCGSPIRHVLQTVQNTHRPALLLINKMYTDNLFDFYTSRLEHHLQINLFGCDETSSVAYNLAKLKLAHLLFGRSRLLRNPRKRLARGRRLRSPETLQYSDIFKQFFVEKLSIFNICEPWSGVMWKSCKRTTCSVMQSGT